MWPPVSPVGRRPAGLPLLAEAFLRLVALQPVHHLDGHLRGTAEVRVTQHEPRSCSGDNCFISVPFLISHHMIQPPSPFPVQTHVPPRWGGLTPAPQSPSHLSGSLHLNTEFKGLLRPPPDHESQMNPRIKDPLPKTPAPPTASRPCSIGRSPLFPHLEMLIHFVRARI